MYLFMCVFTCILVYTRLIPVVPNEYYKFRSVNYKSKSNRTKIRMPRVIPTELRWRSVIDPSTLNIVE